MHFVKVAGKVRAVSKKYTYIAVFDVSSRLVLNKNEWVECDRRETNNNILYVQVYVLSDRRK